MKTFSSAWQRFLQQIETRPEAIAVEFEGVSYSYRDLYSRAEELAVLLTNESAAAGVPIGICIPRSFEMIAGVFAILGVGSAYVPLDPLLPKERLVHIVRQADLRKILCHSSTVQLLSGDFSRSVDLICVDLQSSVSPKIRPDSTSAVEPFRFNWTTAPESLAYVIYTSGSTGVPKGVMITHESLSAFVTEIIRVYRLSPQDRVLQFFTISFDASVEEIFGCLCSGATLVLRDDEMIANLSKLCQACKLLNISVLNLPTSYWHQLMSEVECSIAAVPRSLRLLIIGGEAALQSSHRKWKLWLEKSSEERDVEVINTYGPTETTVAALHYKVPSAAQSEGYWIPIGSSFGHLVPLVVNARGEVCAEEEAGELWLSGPGLAAGYLNSPELTARKFLIRDHPKTGVSTRFYTTGDLVVLRKDQNFDFLGRIDNQVKIRGFRVELSEVEQTLSRCPGVEQCVVSIQGLVHHPARFCDFAKFYAALFCGLFPPAFGIVFIRSQSQSTRFAGLTPLNRSAAVVPSALFVT